MKPLSKVLNYEDCFETLDEAKKAIAEIQAAKSRVWVAYRRQLEIAQRWEGKFRVVCQENNQLRKKLEGKTQS